MGQFFGAKAPGIGGGYSLDPATLLDLAAPRKYYLWTTFPAIVSTTRTD